MLDNRDMKDWQNSPMFPWQMRNEMLHSLHVEDIHLLTKKSSNETLSNCYRIYGVNSMGFFWSFNQNQRICFQSNNPN